MANEKAKATALEQAAKEAKAKAVETNENGNLIVQRETFTAKKDKREMYGYFVLGKYRGRDIKVDFVADDQGGYETLDLIFSIAPTAELLITEAEMTNDDGSKMAYTVYEVRNVDEDGIEVRYKVKPSHKSDLTNLSVLLQIVEIEKAKAAKAQEQENATEKVTA